MRSQTRKALLDRFCEACRTHGLAMTVQRRTILQAVMECGDHPTTDCVYERVKKRIPAVSRTTVYRVLETLVKIGVVAKISHPGPAARYDPKTDQHHHLVCLHCDRISDLDDPRLNAVTLPSVETRGFLIKEFQIYFRGICPTCQQKSHEVKGTEAGTRIHAIRNGGPDRREAKTVTSQKRSHKR